MLLTGFLGAGKTTLLNALLRDPAMSGTAVVINEYGAVGLDHHLVEQAEPDEIELIEGGCLCCTARGKLGEALMALFTKAQRRQIPSLRRVIIETTGLAEPGPILQQLARHAPLRDRFVLDSVVTLVDAANAATTIEQIDIAQQQITAADRLLLSKSDLVDAGTLAALQAQLAAMNPDAAIEVVAKGAARPEQLFSGARREPGAGAFRIGRWLDAADAMRLQPILDLDAELAHGEAPAWPDPYDIQTFSVIVDAPLPASRFFGWLEFMRSLAGADLLRIKGIVNLEFQDRPRVIHGVQNCIHPVESLPAWPSADHRTRLVFITRGLARDSVRSTLNYLLDADRADEAGDAHDRAQA
ncbi:MAG: GTP-binding protein [Nevskia sp.]